MARTYATRCRYARAVAGTTLKFPGVTIHGRILLGIDGVFSSFRKRRRQNSVTEFSVQRLSWNARVRNRFHRKHTRTWFFLFRQSQGSSTKKTFFRLDISPNQKNIEFSKSIPRAMSDQRTFVRIDMLFSPQCLRTFCIHTYCDTRVVEVVDVRTRAYTRGYGRGRDCFSVTGHIISRPALDTP